MAGEGVIILPWPPKGLSPNARLHWRALARIKKAYKLECWAILANQPRPTVTGDRIPLLITISPPDKRRRDRDNMQHSLKYALDMLASRMGVDDSRFEPTYRFAESVPGGLVTVDLSTPPDIT